jgi:hypothetical protein
VTVARRAKQTTASTAGPEEKPAGADEAIAAAEVAAPVPTDTTSPAGAESAAGAEPAPWGDPLSPDAPGDGPGDGPGDRGTPEAPDEAWQKAQGEVPPEETGLAAPPDAASASAAQDGPAPGRADWAAERPGEPQDWAAPPPAADAATPAAPPPQIHQTVIKRAGFLPLALGGLVAGALGLAAGWYLAGQWPAPTPPFDPAPIEAQLSAQAARIDGLEARLGSLPAPVDPAPLLAGIAEARAEAQAAIDALSSSLADLSARIGALERAPQQDGTLSESAIAAWQAEIEALGSAIADQRARLEAIAGAVAQQGSRLEALATDTDGRLSAIEADVERQARAAAEVSQEAITRAALARVLAALDSGAPFEQPLGELAAAGIALDPALVAAAAEGVPSNAALLEGFPAAHRAALAALRAEGLAEDGGNRLLSLLRRLFDVRSVTPREGSDPDAILSRAEASLRENRLGDALAEIAALPEVARAAMTDWLAAAQKRADALRAATALAETLNAN